jgi:predicted RNA-binding Zn ribbon-like protein
VRLRPDPQARQTDGAAAGFLWIADRPALDLCNTRLGALELLRDTSDLTRWMSLAGVGRDLPVSAAELAAARALRDGLRAALLAPDRTRVGALAHGWLDGVSGRLCVDPGTLETRFVPGGGSARDALVTVVLDALELARERPGRVRECAAPSCPLVYLDVSRNRSRRWCSMERCGARAKAATYHRRHAGRRAG